MRALVTGGGGFLGGAIVERLLARGDTVRSFSRSDYPGLRRQGVEIALGDLADYAAVKRAVEGCEVVFHVAAQPGIWGPYERYYRTNVVGTENVLKACRQLSIRRLIYTSSPSVVFNGQDMEGVNETAPYPEQFEAFYPQTKALAEQMILAANGPSIATVALRPHLIWGPGDNHLVPRIIARAKSGQLRRIGAGRNRVDSVYIDNAADAHVLAADRLEPGSPIGGKAYFITNGEPLPLWELVNRILAAADLPPVTQSIPTVFAIGIGGMMELLYKLTGRTDEPPMTRFLARELSAAHWFDISAARRDLGYEPRVSIAEGLSRLADWLRSQGCSEPA